MKILIVNKFLHPNGGSETYIFNLGRRLAERGNTVEYFGMDNPARIVGNSWDIYTPDMNFRSSTLRSVGQKLTYPFRIIYSRKAYRLMGDILKRMEPDVVHLNNINFQLTPSIIRAVDDWRKTTGRRCRIVATIHDSQWVCPNHTMVKGRRKKGEYECRDCFRGNYGNCIKGRCIHGSLVKSLLGAIEAGYYRKNHIYRQVDRIIAPSSYMAEVMSFNPDLAGRIVMLRNFIDRDRAALTGQSREKVLDAVGLGRDDRFVLYFGRYSEEKGIDTLLEAVAKLPDICFVMAGTGPMEEQLAKYSNIKNLGFLKSGELDSIIAQAEFSLITSEWAENCPFSVMESLYMGTPVIGSAIGGIPELIEEGATGELYACGNGRELAEHIRELWEDKDRVDKYRANCKAGICFDTPDEYIDKLMEIYTHDGK